MGLRHIQICTSNDLYQTIPVVSHSDPETVYEIIIPDPDDLDNVICECKGFEFRGYCKHTQEAIDALCRWHPKYDPEFQSDEQRQEGICPKCGEPTMREWIWE